MTKKKGGGIASRLSRRYDVQPEVLFGGCRLELRGRSSLSVGGCCGIVEYSPDAVTLRLRDGFFRVCGESLSCDSYTFGEVLISGWVNSMSFEESAV